MNNVFVQEQLFSRDIYNTRMHGGGIRCLYAKTAGKVGFPSQIQTALQFSDTYGFPVCRVIGKLLPFELLQVVVPDKAFVALEEVHH